MSEVEGIRHSGHNLLMVNQTRKVAPSAKRLKNTTEKLMHSLPRIIRVSTSYFKRRVPSYFEPFTARRA